MSSFRHSGAKRQSGAALLLILLVAITVGLVVLFTPIGSISFLAAREQNTGTVLAHAKEAVIGKAVTDATGSVFGFLPLPDLGSSRNTVATEGTTAGNFTGNAQNLSVIGRLPWRTLGLAPLKDANGECLWYAVSGSAQSAQTVTPFNWDTIGHFELFRSDGTPAGTLSTTGTNYHDRPLAIIFSSGSPLAGQDRRLSATDNVTECGGNYDVRNYLDSYTGNANINSIVNYFAGTTNNASDTASALASPKAMVMGDVSVASGTEKVGIVNDRLVTITAKEVFDRVKKRSEFESDINTLLDRIQVCLNATAPLAASSLNKGIAPIVASCRSALPASVQTTFDNWKDNLLYAGGPSGSYTISGIATACKGLLFFAGERTTRTVAPLSAQVRATPAQKGDSANTGDAAMYLEGVNAANFPNNGAYVGAGNYSKTSPSADVIRCITGNAGATQVSFDSNLNGLTPSGPNNGAAVAVDTTEQTVTISAASGISNGCLWFPTAIPLAGKTLRAHYEFQFKYSDTYATTGAPADRGYGFTLEMVDGVDFGTPSVCGSASNMGALISETKTVGGLLWGSSPNFIVETDVRQNSTNDPAGNHTAIMINGNLNHGSEPTTSCNGTSSACLYTPANTFEESPTPLLHNQRIEIHTGCGNNTCTQCNPSSSGTYAKISVWVDCIDCSDVVTDYVDAELISLEANRTFTGIGNWSGTNWALSGGTFAHTAGANAATLPNAALSSAAVIGKSYRIDLDINTVTPGTLTVGFGGNTTTVLNLSAVGLARYRIEIDALNTDPFTLTPDSSWEGSISSASIHAVRTPTANRCIALDSTMSQIYFGLTGGFLSDPNTVQGVTIKNLYLRSD